MPRSQTSKEYLEDALYTRWRMLNVAELKPLLKQQLRQYWFYIRKARETYNDPKPL